MNTLYNIVRWCWGWTIIWQSSSQEGILFVFTYMYILCCMQSIVYFYSYTWFTLIQDNTIKLADGYDVFVTRQQLSEAVTSSQKQPKKLMRALLAVFFEPHILAKSCALGTRSENAGLDKEILGACICKYLLCFLCYLLNFRIFSLTFHCCRLCSDTTWCSSNRLNRHSKWQMCSMSEKKSTGMLV